ncbi:hypothetical protein HA402_006036 [Bradysia odoriphaga]|nr:hypothetical protein HA402_006036 [Bradysia odoriphaga]
MKTLKFIAIYVIGLASLLIIYLFSNIDASHWTKTPHVQVKIYPTYYGNNLHSEWSFNTSKNYNESNIYKWSEPTRAANVTWQEAGENGTKFVASADLTELMDQLIEQENYNLLASDMISLHRSLPDSRSDECKRLSYPEKLPNTSVVIIFHNEAWTPLITYCVERN